MKERKKLSKNGRIVVASGLFIISMVVLMLLLEFFVFDKFPGDGESLSGVLTSSAGVLTLSVLLITAINLRAVSKRERETEKRLGVADTLISCITVLAEVKDIDEAINRLLEILNDFFDGDRAYLFEFDYENMVTNNSYEYASEGITKEIDNLQNIPLSVIDVWIKKFEETGTFYISSLDRDVDRDSDAYRILDMQQIQSLIAVPLIENERVIGFLGIDNPKINFNDLSLLSSATFFILDSIDRRESHALLHRLSFEDALTSVYNRNRFNHVLDESSGKVISNIGVAYFDINGLKRVNDTSGHQAGDELIKKTADSISRFFDGSVYRIGGDEFVVIAYPVDEREFSLRVCDTIKEMNDNGISVSAGVAWAGVCGSIEELLVTADEMMYKQKTEHYEKRGCKKSADRIKPAIARGSAGV